MHSTGYILRFVLIMTSVAALGLSSLFYATKGQADMNEAIFKKRGVLAAVDAEMEKPVSQLSDDEVQQVFDERVEQLVIDDEGQEVPDMIAEDVNMAKEQKKPETQRKLPLYVYSQEDEKYYIVVVRGSGLWDAIWGTVAVEDDFNTIAGASFDHKAETPGLGAEIKDNPLFAAQFRGKKLYNVEGEYVSVDVVKGSKKNVEHEVDAISGATVTSDGVAEMLDRGIEYYLSYFEKLESQKQDESLGMR